MSLAVVQTRREGFPELARGAAVECRVVVADLGFETTGAGLSGNSPTSLAFFSSQGRIPPCGAS